MTAMKRTTPTTLDTIASHPRELRKRILIDAVGGPQPFLAVVEKWQLADFEAMDNAWLRVVGLPSPSETRMRAFVERPRGHAKTSDLAIQVTWALLAAKNSISGIAAARDKDQGKLIRDAIARIVRLNPWLEAILDVQQYKVVNRKTGSTLEILSADADSGFGQVVQFCVADELCHWSAGAGEDFWSMLFSTVAKRGEDVLCWVITNAGVGQGSSWQWRVRESCRLDPDRWFFSSLDGPRASWITEAILEEQRRLLPDGAFRRLWLNQWSVAGDAISEEDIQAAIDDRLALRQPPRAGCEYYSGLDGSLTTDFSALVTIGLDYDARHIFLADINVWIPPKGGQIDLDSIEHAVVDTYRRYGGVVNFDNYQLAMMAQHARRQGVNIQEVNFRTQSSKLAMSLLSAFRDRVISIPSHKQLIDDLRRVAVVESPDGRSFKLAAARLAGKGHADAAIALACALLGAIDSMNGCGPVCAVDFPFWLSDAELARSLPAASISSHHAHLHEPPPPGLSRFGGFLPHS
jgi:hypothetical protein